MDERDITLGEVYRLLQRQEEQLGQILIETKKTNGNVIRHEARLDGLDREVRDLKRRHADTKPAPAAATVAPADSDSAAGITKRDLKVVAAVLGALDVALRLGPGVVKFLLASGGA